MKADDVVKLFKSGKATKEQAEVLLTKKNIRQRWASDQPSATVVTIADDYISPWEDRTFSVREMARCQSFDDSFEFLGKRTTGGLRRRVEVPQYTQVGKGITVEIGGDTTKLQTALKGVNGQIKNTQSALKDVEKLLKLDPTNTTLLAQKQKLLTQAIGETKEKLATLKTAAQQANEQLQKFIRDDDLKRALIEMAHIPVGYKIVEGCAVVDETAAEQIRATYRYYFEGKSLINAAKEAGFKMNHASVKRMLSNKKYAGPGRTAKKSSFKNGKREEEKGLQQQICIIEHHILW